MRIYPQTQLTSYLVPVIERGVDVCKLKPSKSSSSNGNDPPPRPKYGDPAMQWWKGGWEPVWSLPCCLVSYFALLSDLCNGDDNFNWVLGARLLFPNSSAARPILPKHGRPAQGANCWHCLHCWHCLQCLHCWNHCWTVYNVGAWHSSVGQLKMPKLNGFGSKIWFQHKLKPAQSDQQILNLFLS